MRRANPVYIPRNHLVAAALTAATEGDSTRCTGCWRPSRRRTRSATVFERCAEPAPEEFGRCFSHLRRHL